MCTYERYSTEGFSGQLGCTASNVIFLSFFQVLTKAMEYKSMCLANPKEMYQSMVTCQLFSHHSQSVACTPDMMRENILTSGIYYYLQMSNIYASNNYSNN